MTSGDFDFFGAPTTPPPSGPPAGSQFGAPAPASQFGTPVAPPAVNQFGTPVAPSTNQFGMPAMAPTRPLTPAPSSGNGRQLAVLGGIAAALVLAVGGFIWLQGEGKKTATKVANTVETPIVKAHQTVEIMDLQQASQAEETYLTDHSSYATSVSDLTGFVPSPGTRITVVSATATAYCLRADDVSTLPAPSMYVASGSSGATTTPCS